MKSFNFVGSCSALALVLAVGCNVESTSKGSQGVDLGDDENEDSGMADSEGDDPSSEGDATVDAAAGDAGEAFDSAASAGGDAGVDDSDLFASDEASDVRGFIVVRTDYTSTVVSVIDTKGKLLSSQLVSSASAETGTSLPLSGDVIVPTATATGAEIVLLDRGNSVLDWVDLETAEVTQQVNVGPGGFTANPYDYVQVSPSKAYISRYERNPNSGEAKLDQGGDLLIIDPQSGKLTGRVDLDVVLGDDAADYNPRPDSIAFVNGKVYVALAVSGANFGEFGMPRLVQVDAASGEVGEVLELDGLKNCGELVASPDHSHLALSCWGTWGEDLTAEAGIVLLDVSGDSPEVQYVFEASAELGVQPNALAFANDDVLLFSAYGSYESDFVTPKDDDGLYSLVIADGDEFGDLSESLLDSGPFTLSEVSCAPKAKACALADAEANAVQLLTLDDDGQVSAIETIAIEDEANIPPRYIGTF